MNEIIIIISDGLEDRDEGPYPCPAMLLATGGWPTKRWLRAVGPPLAGRPRGESKTSCGDGSR